MKEETFLSQLIFLNPSADIIFGKDYFQSEENSISIFI
jgi:hypothetical protein